MFIKKLTVICIIFVSTFVISLEFFSFILTKYNLLPFNQIPTYSLTYPKGLGVSWRTEKDQWGAWHKKNYFDNHKYNCFDVTYVSNNIGARDKEDYKLNSKDKTIMLVGDSMLEGVGVNYENTLPSLIKEKTGIQTINLSAAGDFGPVQYYLINDYYKDKFNYDDLYVFFLPYNDFTDNDWNFWKDVDTKRYRPYFKKINDSEFDIFYPDNAKRRQSFGIDISLKGLPKTIINNFTYSSNVLRFFKYRKYLNESNSVYLGTHNSNSGYYFQKKDAIDGSIYFLEKLFKNNANKKITLITVPFVGDIISHIDKNDYTNLYWYIKINNLVEKYNINFLDLMNYIDEKNYNGYFLECDGHWNENGHLWALNSIFKKYE